MTPAARADETRRRGHVETIDHLEREDEHRLSGPVRDVAAGGFNDRGAAVADEPDDSPLLIADADDGSRAKWTGFPGHPGGACMACSRAGEAGFQGSWVRCVRNLPARDRRGASIRTKARGRGAQVGLGGIPEFLDQRVALQRLLDDAALDALAAPVNETDLAEPRLVGGADVLFDHRLDVARREGARRPRAPAP